MNNIIFYLLYSLAHQYLWFDYLIKFFAVYFIYIIILILTINLALQTKIFSDGVNIKSVWNRSKGIIIIIFSTGVAYILSNLLKLAIHTDRPFVALSNIQTLISESGYAFPSGHSATIAAFALAMYFRNKRLGILALVAMVLIGVARVAAGVHFPVDILGGYILGFGVAYLLKRL